MENANIYTRNVYTNNEIEAIASPEGMHAVAYTDPAIFELEMERIFRRVWVFVGHESQVPITGDFKLTWMGTDEVILVRQANESLRVLSNNCSHRGTRLCTVSAGNTKSFVCPYHAWGFGLDGKLKAVPDMGSYPNTFDMNDRSLHLKSAARVDSYRGFVFASKVSEGPSLKEFLGSMTEAIDNLIDRAPGGEISIDGGNFSIRYRGNWKLHLENANDTVHPGYVHESSVTSAREAEGGIVPQVHLIDRGQTKGMMA